MAEELPPLIGEDEIEFRREQKEEATFLDWAGKLVIMGAGAQIFTRKVLKYDWVSRAANLLGRFYDKSYLAASSLGRTSRRSLSNLPQSARHYVDQYGNIGSRELDLHNYIRQSLDLMTSPNIDANIAERTRLLQEGFEREYAKAVPHHYDESLRRLQIGEVLDNQERFMKELGQERFSAIKEAHKAKILRRDHILDKNIYIDKHSQALVDARLKDPRQLFASAIDRFNPLNIFNPVRAMLDKPGIVRVSSRAKFAAGHELPPGDHVYVFGDLFRIDNGKFVKTNVPFKMMPVQAGSGMHQALSVTTGQAVYSKVPGEGISAAIQNATGIGPYYATRKSLIGSLFNPLRAATSRRSGKAVPKLYQFVSQESSSIASDILASQGLVSEVTEGLARSGNIPIKNPFKSIDEMRFFGGKAGRTFFEKLTHAVERQKILTGGHSRYGALFDNSLVTKDPIATSRTGVTLQKDAKFFQTPFGGRMSVDNPLLGTEAPQETIKRAKRLIASPRGPIDSIMAKQITAMTDAERQVYETLRSVRPNTAGDLTSNRFASHAFYSPYTVLKGAGNYLSTRLNALTSTTFGIGFRPSSSLLANIGRVAAIPVAGMFAYRTAEYADFELDRIGLSPSKGAAYLYTQARVGQQQLRENLGLSSVFERTEQVMPGFFESGIGFLGRHGLIAAGSYQLAARTNPFLALLAGLAGYTTIGGTSLGQSPQELKEEYAGERLVPVRKGRMWGFGRCLEANQDVLLANFTIKKAHEIRINDILISATGSCTEVQKVASRKTTHDEKIINISATGMPDLIRVTDKHPVLVHRHECPYVAYTSGCHPHKLTRNYTCKSHNNRPSGKCTYQPELNLEYVEAENIEQYDYVVAPKLKLKNIMHIVDLRDITDPDNFIEDDDRIYKSYKGRNKCKIKNATLLDPNIHLNYDLGVFTGWYLAEGNDHNKKGHSLEFTFDVREMDFARGMGKLTEELFNANVSMMTRVRGKWTSGKLVASSPFLKAFITHLGILDKNNCDFKNLINCSDDFLKGLLVGYFYGDGTYCKQGDVKKWSAKSSRKNIALFLNAIIIALGGLSYIGHSIFKGYHSYVIYIIRPVQDLEFIKHYIRVIPTDYTTAAHIIDTSDYVLYPIRSITASETDVTVYDFQVSNDSSFCIDGIAVHNSALEGGRIDYYTTSWYQKLLKKPAMRSIYGGPEAYFAKHANVFGIPFPSAESVFGLRQIMDPYALERETYYDRPYPVTGQPLQEVPIFGTLLGETVGQFIKPTKKMHPEAHTGPQPVHTNIYNTHIPANTSSLLGINPYPIRGINVAEAGKAKERMELAAHQLTEPYGFYKFIAERMLGVLPSNTYKEADSAAIGSTARAFYNMQIGGAVGLSEMWRRFALPEMGDPSKLRLKVNPIQNSLPGWLPGSNSEFPQDRFNWDDFHRGDPYSSIYEGETRLPGAGYEHMFGLHSGISGVYDPIDRFLVLSQTAPYSEAYRKYSGIAQGMLEKGQLEGKWSTLVQSALEGSEQKKSRFEYYPRIFTKETSARRNILDFKADISSANLQMKFSGPERILGTAWEVLSHDVLAQVPYVGAKLAPFYSPLEHYEKFQLYGSEAALWHEPWSGIIRPTIYENVASPPIIGALKGATLGFLLGSSASPMSLFNPVPALRSPTLTGLGAIAGSVGSWGRVIGTGGAYSGGFIPPHVQRQREVEEYFDKIRYVKARNVEELALSQGNSQLAAMYQREAASTYSGMTAGSNVWELRRSLSRNERAYFDSFKNAPEYLRNNILSTVSPGASSVYNKLWNNKGEFMRTKEEADQQVVEYLNAHVMPSRRSPIWHPSVPMQAIKASFLDAGINGVSDSFNKFDVYPRTMEETRQRFPEIYDHVPTNIDQGIIGSSLSAISNILNPFDNSIRSLINPFGGSSAHITIYAPPSDRSFMHLQDMMR